MRVRQWVDVVKDLPPWAGGTSTIQNKDQIQVLRISRGTFVKLLVKIDPLYNVRQDDRKLCTEHQ